MATAQKKSSGGKRTASSGGRSRTGTTSRAASSRKKPAPKPVRREVGALVCLLLAIFSALGCFIHDAIFIDFFCGSVKGLIGYGFYVLPVMLLVACGVLAFHRGRPVRLRVWCALLTPVLLGAFFHLILARGEYTWGWGLVGTLWDQGRQMASGGVVGGLLALSFSAVFSKLGAGIVFVLIGLLMLMAALNVTVVDVVDYLRTRPRPEYEEEEIPQRPPREPRPPREDKRRPVEIDIPVDEGPLVGKKPEPPLQKKKEKLFNRKPSVPTPDQVLIGEPAQDAVQEEEYAAAAPVVDEPAAPVVDEPAAPVIPEPVPAPQPIPEMPTPQPVPQPTPEPPPPPAPEIVREPAVPKTAKEARAAEAAQLAQEVTRDIERSLGEEPPAYLYPPVSLLREGEGPTGTDVAGELKANQARLSETIHSFGIDANIVDVTRGPSVTRYELELDQGVRLNKLTNLSDDIALALGATGVRIAPIPNKISMVGIEVPNRLVSPVYIHEVIDSAEFRNHTSKVAFKATPEEVRLIMVDPKMVELGIYNGIPHLLIPVVTDPKKAAGALQWAVTEMMKRYRAFSEVGVRDLASYNAHAARSNGELNKMPQIVVVIDELADLMLVAAKEVEESICRVAQMGRAAGMHLIIATQRPSADVITGLMKANIPSRIAFAVASSLESRIILDTTGAEKLVGRGDMLYFPLGTGKPQRVQGCLISDEEVASVVDFIKRNSGAADYDQSVIHEIEQHAAEKEKGAKGSVSAAEDGGSEGYDELLPAAIEVVVETGQASVSMLQRRLKLGYSRAARLVDQMEEKGVVGPFEGSKPRQLLITKEQWQEMQFKQGMVDRAPDAGLPPVSEPVPDELEGERDAIPQPRELPPF